MNEIKRLENKIAERNSFFNSISAGVIRLDFDNNLRMLDLNERGYKMFGYTKEQLAEELNNEAMNLVYKEDKEKTVEFMRAIRDNNYLESYQHRIVRRDGKILWMQGTASAYLDEEGNKSAVITFLDITERKELERKLSEKIEDLEYSEKRYELAVIHADVIVFDYIIANKQIIYSPLAIEKYGCPPIVDDAVEKYISAGKIHTISVDKIREAYRKIVGGEAVVNCTIVLMDNNGKESLNDLSLTNIFDKKGKPIRAIGILKDITQQMVFANDNQYKDTLVAGSLINYEINLSKDMMISGAEFWKKALNLNTNYFSQIIMAIKDKFIYSDDRKDFEQFIFRDNLIKLFNKGVVNTKLEYRRLVDSNKFIWVSNTIHLIRDINTRDIKALCYVVDINDWKEQELAIYDQKYYYDLFVSKAARVYKINVTKSILVQSNEKMSAKELRSDYDQTINFFIENILYKEDIVVFKEKFLRENITTAYRAGVKEIYSEHRQINKEGVINWFSLVMHLSENESTKDIHGIIYIQNINDSKVKEIELIYKSEHDALTDVYNKITTEKMIEDYLFTEEGRRGSHAFFIFDIDCFKPINDNFGHVFGDMILSQVAQKVKVLFRSEDIIGRIGGDEFVVFMKNISATNLVATKANEICVTVHDQYKQKGKEFNLSSSIGIALYPEHGINYRELYMNADTALYVSKENGRNKFTFYSEKMNYTPTSIKNIDNKKFIEDKVFEANVTEYVFRILYESNDKEAAIDSILELTGKHFRVSRTYIFEESEDRLSLNNTFEWCNEGINSHIEELKNIRYEDIGNYWERFDRHGIYYMADVFSETPEIKAILEPQGVKSMLQFSIVQKGVFKGFIGFDQNEFIRVGSKSEISEMKLVANLLGIFILELRASQKNEDIKNTALSIVNALNSYSYVINRSTYKLLFINEKARTVVKTAQVGDTCYKAFWQKNSPCEICPMNKLSKDGREDLEKHNSLEIYNDILDLWVKSTASWINWTDGEEHCLIESLDINDYKKNN